MTSSCTNNNGFVPKDQDYRNLTVTNTLTACQIVGKTADIDTIHAHEIDADLINVTDLNVQNITIHGGSGGFCGVGLKTVCGVPPSLPGQIPVIQDDDTSILANSNVTISGPLSEDLSTPGTVTTASLILPAASSSNTVTLQSTSTISTNTVYNLPSDGTAGYVLTTDGSGNLYWSSDLGLPHFPDIRQHHQPQPRFKFIILLTLQKLLSLMLRL